MARGHFHERVGESPVHWLPPGVGFTQKPFSVSENGPFENFLRSVKAHISYQSVQWRLTAVSGSFVSTRFFAMFKLMTRQAPLESFRRTPIEKIV